MRLPDEPVPWYDRSCLPRFANCARCTKRFRQKDQGYYNCKKCTGLAPSCKVCRQRFAADDRHPNVCKTCLNARKPCTSCGLECRIYIDAIRPSYSACSPALEYTYTCSTCVDKIKYPSISCGICRKSYRDYTGGSRSGMLFIDKTDAAGRHYYSAIACAECKAKTHKCSVCGKDGVAFHDRKPIVCFDCRNPELSCDSCHKPSGHRYRGKDPVHCYTCRQRVEKIRQEQYRANEKRKKTCSICGIHKDDRASRETKTVYYRFPLCHLCGHVHVDTCKEEADYDVTYVSDTRDNVAIPGTGYRTNIGEVRQFTRREKRPCKCTAPLSGEVPVCNHAYPCQ